MDLRLLQVLYSIGVNYIKAKPLQFLLEKPSAAISSVTGIIIITFLLFRLSQRPNLHAFPTVGSGLWWPWLSLGHAFFQRHTNFEDMLQQGYKKYKSAPFKIADKNGWLVIMSNHKHVEELLRAPEEELSIREAANDRINFVHTLGQDFYKNPLHIVVIRHLTRNIGVIYPELRNEVVAAFDDLLDLKGEEWQSTPVLSTIQKIVCRVSNRAFVGLPLCRDPDWIGLNIRFTHIVATQGLTIGNFPDFMKPLVAYFFTGVAKCIKQGIKQFGPIVEERLNYIREYGKEWTGKPMDLLSWLADEAKDLHWTVKFMVVRVMFVNFTAMHSASVSFTHVLFYLAGNPQYVQPLREEVESIVEKEGWSRAALSKMVKVDSFLKECQRLEGTNILSLERKAMKDCTFSDGTFIPRGTVIGVPIRCIHHDGQLYDNATDFDPFRFVDMHSASGEEGKRQFISTATDFLSFGYGVHACPGRLFAACELKTMLAHVVTSYDLKLEEGAMRPASLLFGSAVVPDPRAKVMFRKKVD